MQLPWSITNKIMPFTNKCEAKWVVTPKLKKERRDERMSRTVGVRVILKTQRTNPSGEPNTKMQFPYKPADWSLGFRDGNSWNTRIGRGLGEPNFVLHSDRSDHITTTTLKPWALLYPMSAIIGRHWNMSFPKPFFSWKNDQGRDRSLQALISPL